MKSRKGFRKDLGFNCDSKAEANVARILKHLNIEFQPYSKSKKRIYIGDKGFRDRNDKHLLKEMRPDFYLPKENTYIEVKGGWGSFTPNDRYRLIGTLMKEDVRIVEICGVIYGILEKAFKKEIPEWE